jgi:hypothetical protein
MPTSSPIADVLPKITLEPGKEATTGKGTKTPRAFGWYRPYSLDNPEDPKKEEKSPHLPY